MVGGNNANFNQNKWNYNNNNRNFGFSGRLLKNWNQELIFMVNFCFMMFYGIMIDSEQLLLDLFQAYYDARKHKRNTRSAVAFEMNYETKLFQLYDELIT
ncbi:MAG: hypothetical protein WCJ81_09365 [bacterium]